MVVAAILNSFPINISVFSDQSAFLFCKLTKWKSFLFTVRQSKDRLYLRRCILELCRGKSKFQEKAQEKESLTPMYKSLKEDGPDHDKRFTVGVFLENELIAEGEGMSKQEAEQEAARKALEIKKWL